MSKKIIVGMLILFLLLSSCAGSAGLVIWDESIPEEETATVHFMNMKIDSFNGIHVTDFNRTRIPAGLARLGGEVRAVHAGLNFVLRDMEFSFNFEAGKSYMVSGATQNMQWGVNVYDVTGQQSARATADNRIDFIPFREQPVF